MVPAFEPSPAQPAGPVLWTPSESWRTSTRIGSFVRWVERHRGLRLDDYDVLWRWSVDDLDGFWTAVWEHFGVASATAPGPALASASMPGARWFPGARLNYAKYLLEDADPARFYDDEQAIVAYSQTRDDVVLTFAELRDRVARVQFGLRRLGVGEGDRVVAWLPSIPETVVAFLATVSLGAVWASCAPEFGPSAVVDRFSQLEPTVLLAVSGYRYGVKSVDRGSDVGQVRAGLPTLRAVVHVPYGEFDHVDGVDDVVTWAQLIAEDAAAAPTYTEVPFDHPLFVLFSSGTTGPPKAIVHGHGGVLLEHLKNHALSFDLGPRDRLLWYSTTAWMVWNVLVSAMLCRSTAVLVDGNPVHPNPHLLWELAERSEATVVGLSPGFIMADARTGSHPATAFDLHRVRSILAAGSPLPSEGYRWITEEFPGVLLNVGSGGTDVCSGIVQGSPLQPVVEGEISGACLGVDAQAFDAAGRPVVGDLGELVITRPMPSMPVGFWGDPDGERYRTAYFDTYPGIWRHGDWVRFSASGSCVVAGRSDATLNRGGVRLGTAEFYGVVDQLDEVEDSLVVHLEDPDGGMGQLILFVVPAGGAAAPGLADRLKATIRSSLSPRHVPDTVVPVPVVPRNRTGKKLELPVKRILQGDDSHSVVAPGSLQDDHALDPYTAYANRGHLGTAPEGESS